MTNIVTTESGEKFTLFFTIRSPFSNFHPCRFVIVEDCGNGELEERCYYSTEQYYMYHKALSAGDNETAKQIANERDARKIKTISRSIKNFERETWNRISGDVMRKGNLAKYTQNPMLRKKLFYTYGSTLVECSPTDVEWGIGLDINEPDALSPSKWRGKNKLGQILTEIREELWSKPEYANEVNDILSMLENFDTFSRQFFLPPKPRMQQSIRLSLGENEDDNDKRRSLPSSLAVDRSGYGNRDKRRSVPSYPCAERSENINGSGVRHSSSAKLENDSSMFRERRSRSRSRNGRRHYRRSPSYGRDRSRRHSSSDDSRNRERKTSQLRKRKTVSSRSRYDAKSRHGKHRSCSENDHDSSRNAKRQRRRSDSSSDGRSHSMEKDRQRQRNVSSSVDEESTSAAEGTLDEEVKKVATDPFRSLLEKLRRKQCGMWEKGAPECNNTSNETAPVGD